MTKRAQKCEENAQRVTDPFLREAYARFASYWRRRAQLTERREKRARRTRPELL